MPRTTEQILRDQEQQVAAERSKTMATVLNEPFTIDEDGGSKPLELIPAGTYKAEILSSIIYTTKSGDGQYVKNTWRICEGEYEGRQVFQLVNFSNPNPKAEKIGREQLTDICLACDLVGELQDLNDICLKPCAIKVGVEHDKTGEYPDSNKVRRVLPVGMLATPEQTRQGQATNAARRALKIPPASLAGNGPWDDEIPPP
jgi:hypothetical protein